MTTAFVLGAAVWPGGPSPTLKRRTLHAAGLWEAGVVRHLVVCGGLGKHPPTEAAVMADILTNYGVPKDAITIEDRSTTTEQNIANAAALVGATAVVIVTDAYHAPRARLIARRLGLKATSSSPPLRGSNMRQVIKSGLRECLAYAAYRSGLR